MLKADKVIAVHPRDGMSLKPATSMVLVFGRRAVCISRWRELKRL